MATAATASATQWRPMPVSGEDFNLILEQQIEMTDGKGRIEPRAFWFLVQDGLRVADELKFRVHFAVRNFESGKGDKPQIAKDLPLFQREYDLLVALSLHSQEVFTQFTEMLTRFDSASVAPLSGRVKNKEDALFVTDKVGKFKDQLKSDYLTKGSWNSYLPDHLEKFKQLVQTLKV